MTRFGWLVLGILALIVLAIGGGAGAWYHLHQARAVPASTEATSTPISDPTGLSIYTSGEYGFSFFYPAGSSIADSYTDAGVGSDDWRQGATGDGTLIVRVAAPSGDVRIGMSSSTREVAACAKGGPAEQALGSLTVGSTTWSRFSFQKLGTENEQQVTSYRTVYKSACFALETFAPLHEQAAAPQASSSAAFGLSDIARSFTFAE